MKSILYVGMDVHKDQFTLCTYSIGDDAVRFQHTVAADYKQVLVYLEKVRQKTVGWKEEVEFVCGYEAGCLGFSLYADLTKHHVNCVILAPTTMWTPSGKNVKKNDKRDARSVAKSLAFGTYKPVHVPTKEDNDVKEYIRMRADHQKALVRIKRALNYWTF